MQRILFLDRTPTMKPLELTVKKTFVSNDKVFDEYKVPRLWD